MESEKKDCPALANFDKATFATQKKTNKNITEADTFKIPP
jgi:hypothetical protein